MTHFDFELTVLTDAIHSAIFNSPTIEAALSAVNKWATSHNALLLDSEEYFHLLDYGWGFAHGVLNAPLP